MEFVRSFVDNPNYFSIGQYTNEVLRPKTWRIVVGKIVNFFLF